MEENGSPNSSLDQNRNCTKICKKLKDFRSSLTSRDTLKPLLYGQGLSILICGTAVTSTYLVQDFNADIPLTQSFCNYFLLMLVYGTMLILQKDENGERIFCEVIKTVGWKYLLVSLADVAANYLIVKAYQYTSLTSVQVLDCSVIPVVMLLSYFALNTRYKIVHYVGVGIALAGVAFMIIADVLLENSTEGASPLIGDFMVLLAATCYGVSNVGMEYAMKTRPIGHTEILALFGIFGSFMTGTLAAILERDALVNVKWSLASGGLLLGFALCMFVLYSTMPLVMKMSSATTVNLSILTADLYALFVGMVLFGYQFTPLYIVSFVVIFVSLIIYNSKPPGVSVVSPIESASSSTENERSLPLVDSEAALLSADRF